VLSFLNITIIIAAWELGMNRRKFITVMGGPAVWPLMAYAQEQKMRRVGALLIGNADMETFQNELRGGLRELGYIEGQNILFEFRSAEGILDRLPGLAAELVRLKVDVIVALYTPCGLAAKDATREIPIVLLTGDPLGTGLVASLARPGGNITGLSMMAAETHGKLVELFRDMLPAIERVAVLTNAADPVFAKLVLEQVELASRITRLEIQPISVRGPDELEAAFATMVRERAEAVVIQGSLSTKRVADLALEHRLPAASLSRSFADVGGLMSYGADGPALFRRSALFVHKILQGNKPTDMPVEQPTKFELVVNLKTASALSIDVPLFFQQRADEVIE
jgi:putative tryptophan/tyrosine transport system substrate-binding protein